MSPFSRRYGSILKALALTLLFLIPALPAEAATTLVAEIVSWQVIGLDSNAWATSNPEKFMVQVEVTNTGAEAATGVQTNLTLGSSAPPCGSQSCVSLASSPSYPIGTIAAGAKADAFWTVRIVKDSAAFDSSTPVSVEVTSDNAPIVSATQMDRINPDCGGDTLGGTLFVERLISQNRNDVISYSISPGVQRPDGSWEVLVGTAFTVEVVAQTATTYDEISVPATIDPAGTITPRSVSFTYEQGTASDDDIYTLNAGGQVVARYRYDASSVGDVTLAQLIYDCSGSSFHYNTDYLVDAITIHVVATPSLPQMSLAKSASPSPASPGEAVTFTITYRNDGVAEATGFVITDRVDKVLNQIVPANGGIFDSATRTITWQIGTVSPLSSGTVSFSATVDDFAGEGTITNVASGDADQFDPIASPPIAVPVRPTLPVTGIAPIMLAILGLACIGFGDALSAPLNWRHVA